MRRVLILETRNELPWPFCHPPSNKSGALLQGKNSDSLPWRNKCVWPNLASRPPVPSWHKLLRIGIPQNILRALAAFLRDRTSCVRVESAILSSHSITASVYQERSLFSALYTVCATLAFYHLNCEISEPLSRHRQATKGPRLVARLADWRLTLTQHGQNIDSLVSSFFKAVSCQLSSDPSDPSVGPRKLYTWASYRNYK